MRKTIGLLMVLVLLFSVLVGCGSPEAPGVAGSSDKATWRIIKEGFFEADSIRYSEGTVKYTVAVFEKDGKFGLVNNKGEVVVPAEYDEIRLAEKEPCGDTWLQATKIVEHTGTSYSVSSDGKLTPFEVGGWGYEGGIELYWYNGGAHIYHASDGDIGSTFDVYKEYYTPRYNTIGSIISEPSSVLPIRQISGFAYDEEQGMDMPVFVSEKYALYDFEAQKMLTEYVYDDVSYIGMVDGVLPVKKGDKWGYVNAEGKEISAFEYDPSEVGTDGWWRSIRFYACVNGYFVTHKGDGFGLMSKTGEVILDPIYEDVSQVDGDGRFWVKEDGKWSLAEVL